jgi:competence ComEA-like helix-hairpin-helix protein
MKMAEPSSGRSPWRLLGRDQVVLYVLSLLVLGLAARRYALSHWSGAREARRLKAGQPVDYRVDLNTAGADELDLLPGIGPAKAARIIEYREAHGPFRARADLAKVPGISRQCAEKLQGLVTPDDGPPPGDTPR